jgi:diacylglycerol kinase (ATP)
MSIIYKNPLLIYNPTAGGGRAKNKFEQYYKKMVDEDLFEKIEVCETKSKEDAIQSIIAIHNDNKFDLLISIGGDGTISTISNGLMKIPFEKRLPIFPLPSGSGDSLLRDFGITDINKSIANFKNNTAPKLYDLLFVEELKGNFKWFCINVLGMGFVSDIANYAVKYGKKFGAFSYVIALFLGLGEFKPYKTTFKYNDGKDEYKSDKNFFTTVSNTKFTGGAVMIAPDAKFDDGLMDVVVLHDINRFQFLKGFFKAFKGTHITEKGCLSFRTNSIEIYSEPNFYLMPDGDIEGNSPIRITIVPKQIGLVI